MLISVDGTFYINKIIFRMPTMKFEYDYFALWVYTFSLLPRYYW